MRYIAILLIACPVFAGEIDWLSDKPPKAPKPEWSPRAQIEETSDRQANPTQAGTKAKAATKGQCKCGPLCDCGDGCQCTADAWKDSCGAVPTAHRAAYMRLQAARSVPQTNFQQGPVYNTTRTTFATGVGGYSSSSMGSKPMDGTGIVVPNAAMFGNTSGCPTGG
jgi:hypothetical protein